VRVFTFSQLVCADRGLSLRHRQMRAAYDRALARGADRHALDAAQAKWRQARSRANDRHTLSVLYAERIRALNAAASKAHRKPERRATRR
jgi:uncharacterized protein